MSAQYPVCFSQTLRTGRVEPSIRVDDHAIVAPRVLRGNKAVEHVVDDALRIARAWIADAAAPRQLEADRVARRHGLPSLGPDGPAGAQRHSAGRDGGRAGASGAGLCTRSKLHKSATGAAPAPPSSITWPSPPRSLPAPPEPSRNSRR